MDWKVLVRSGGGGRVEMEGGLSGWVVVVGDTALEGVSLSSVVGGWIGLGVSISDIFESASSLDACSALVVILDLDLFFDFAMVVNSIC